MATTLTYTVFSLGEAQLHQLHTSQGKVSDQHRREAARARCHSLRASVLKTTLNCPVPFALQLFVMGEVAVELFQESPTAFLQVRNTVLRAALVLARSVPTEPLSSAGCRQRGF